MISNDSTDYNSILWYTAPAKRWIHALPVGNGHLGAMVYGGIKRERIALNHNELWSGIPGDRTAAYLPLGELQINFGGSASVSGYQRGLDLNSAMAYVEYNKDNVSYRRKCFASFPANALVYRIKADAPFGCTISLESRLKSYTFAHDEYLLLRGECPLGKYRYRGEASQRGIQFLAGLLPAANGEISITGNVLHIRDATELTLYFTAETSFNGWDKHPYIDGKEYENPVLERLQKIEETKYDNIYAEHFADYHTLYDQVTLRLDDKTGEMTLPTNERLQSYQKRNSDHGLYELMYHFGRYLMIAGSRSGMQPLNPQGIWNARLYPAWKSAAQGGTYSSLFNAYPPFQIDGNYGYVSGIDKMLLQAPEDNVLLLLPTLPEQWQNGSVKGLAAPDNRQVDIEWKNGRLVSWHITGNLAKLQVFYNGNLLINDI